MWGTISGLSQMWLPDVMTSTPAGEELPGGLGGDAEAAGGVLAVGDDEVERELAPQVREDGPQRVSAGPSP